MKKTYLYLLALTLFVAACGGNNQTGNQDTTAKVEEVDPASIPGIDTVKQTDIVSLKANDDMHFDKELFKVKSGKKITLRLKNIGSQTGKPMSHNVVILQKGTDIATFADEARKFKDQDYIPAAMASSIVAHTKQVIAGKTNETQFTITKPGVYDFICSYPGHWGTMQGKIVAE